MPIEILSEPSANAGGKFAPKADQKRFASFFATVDGEGEGGGFQTEGDLRDGLPFGFGDPRKITGIHRFQDKDKKPNIVQLGSRRLVEMIVDRESTDIRQEFHQQVSRDRADHQVQAAGSATATADGVVRQNEITDRVERHLAVNVQ